MSIVNIASACAAALEYKKYKKGFKKELNEIIYGKPFKNKKKIIRV